MADFVNQTFFKLLQKEFQTELTMAENKLEKEGGLEEADVLACQTKIKNIKEKMGKLTKKTIMKTTLMKDYTDPTKLKAVENEVRTMIKGVVPFVYRADIVSSNLTKFIAKGTAQALVAHFGKKDRSPSKTLTKDEIKRLEVAFTQTDYVGDVCNEYKDYVERCWEEYCRHSSLFQAPYVAVVQSSSFGKSRMLYELARAAKTEKSKMKVLYMCARLHESTGYPEATKKLRDWLFDNQLEAAEIADRLKVIYYHAIANWKDVQTEWLDLFTISGTDTSVTSKLSDTKLPADGSVDTKGRVVVLVIDEARSLLAETKEGKINHFRMLRHALTAANYGICELAKSKTRHGGIFGVLVDTNSKVSDFAPPRSPDPTSRNLGGTLELASFPPFVLTHTMDILWQDHYAGKQSDDNKISGEMPKEAMMDVEDEEMQEGKTTGGGEALNDKKKEEGRYSCIQGSRDWR